MTTLRRNIQDNLFVSAQIVRKYNLGDKNYFFSRFNKINESQLETAWASALKEIQNREIIKDEPNLQNEEKKIASQKASIFDNNYTILLRYLKSEFDVKELKLTDERIERKLRNILANRLLDLIVQEVNDQQEDRTNSPKLKNLDLLKKIKTIFIVLLIIGGFSAPRIINGLTPVETLAIRIYNRSSYKFRIGATCTDGWKSNATGSGACSHHGGVAEWVYKTDHRKTIEECREEAKKISWRD